MFIKTIQLLCYVDERPTVMTNEPLAMRKEDCGFYFDYLRLFCSHISTSSAPLFYLAGGGGGGGGEQLITSALI